VFSIIDPLEFLECFIGWVAGLARARGGHVAIDGKAIRAACDKIHGKSVPYLVNAYMVGAGLCMGQIRVDEKSNEITGIPEMIKWLDLEGATVTIDAIGCQKDIARLLIEKGADFILSVKDNQPKLHGDISLEMQSVMDEIGKETARAAGQAKMGLAAPTPYSDAMSFFEEFGKGHSRMEKRSYYVWPDTACIDRGEWPDVECIGLAVRERTVIRKDKDGNILGTEPSVTIHHYIISREMDAEEFGIYVRGHWGIENSLHWVLDNQLHEDRCTARRGHATENLGLIRKIVFNLMKLDENVGKKTTKAKQIHYRNTPEAVTKLLFETIPSTY
jgi:predicted transposase YbfD/YdcC